MTMPLPPGGAMSPWVGPVWPQVLMIANRSSTFTMPLPIGGAIVRGTACRVNMRPSQLVTVLAAIMGPGIVRHRAVDWQVPNMRFQRLGLRWPWRWWLLALALIAMVPALVGNGNGLPLDSHEALVARTAEEMAQRGNWLVPYFNGEVRLQKPPLAYWAVMVVDRLGATPRNVSDWEARMPSIVSGVVLALATALLGRRLAGRRVGWLAGLLAASSSGYVSFTHSARPEMPYAALCTLGLVFFAESWRATISDPNGKRGRWAAWSGWLMMGLAMLTKGPQLPLLLMLGWVIGLRMAGHRGRIRRAVRPVSGLIIALGVSLWWYLAIYLTVPRAINRWQYETVDRALVAESLLDWLEPYYFYRTAALIVPWVAAFPFVLALPWLKARKMSKGTRLLWWVMMVCIIGLSLPAGRRWYYMLPALAPLAILTAQLMMRFGRALVSDGRGALWRNLLIAHCLAFATAAIVMAATAVGNPETPWPAAVVAALVGVAAAVGIWRSGLNRRSAVAGAVVLCALASLTLFTMMAEAELLWRRKRFDEAAFAVQLGRHVPPDESLVIWRSVWETGTYYAHRTIPVMRTPEKLSATLRRNRGEAIWIITHGEERLPEGFHPQMRLELRDAKRIRFRLWTLEPSASMAAPPRAADPDRE